MQGGKKAGYGIVPEGRSPFSDNALPFTHSLAYSILLSTYYVPDLLPATQDTAVNNTDQVPGFGSKTVSKLLGITIQPVEQLARPPSTHYLPMLPSLPPANCKSFLFCSSDVPRFFQSPSLCHCQEHTSHVFLANYPSDLRANGSFSHEVLDYMLGLALEQ